MTVLVSFGSGGVVLKAWDLEMDLVCTNNNYQDIDM